MERRLESKQPSDPVFVTDYHGESGLDTVEIRIGGRNRGEGRYADLTPWQARKLAVALIWASSGEEPDSDPARPAVMLTFPRKTKSK
jgi:hypothetical protein